MSQYSRNQGGPRDYSSPHIRVRGAADYRRYSGERLRLPNERQLIGPRLKRMISGLAVLAILGGIGVAVYFGVTELLEDDSPAVVTEPATDAAASEDGAAEDGAAEQSAADSAAEPAATPPETAEAQSQEQESPAAESAEQDRQAAPEQGAAVAQEQQAETTAGSVQQQSTEMSIPVSEIQPTVVDMAVVPAQIDGAEIAAERVTAEPIPSGIPRQLGDGAAYDPTEPATVFTSRWPVGTTLRLTRLPGATLLTDEEQAAVVGTEALVVVRGTEASNTDLQLSPAAFDLIAVYGTERIIAVSVEVTAPPPQ